MALEENIFPSPFLLKTRPIFKFLYLKLPDHKQYIVELQQVVFIEMEITNPCL